MIKKEEKKKEEREGVEGEISLGDIPLHFEEIINENKSL